MSELRECPFCGGEAEICSTSECDLHGVYCPSCGAQTAWGGYEAQAEAIAAWNHRKPVNLAEALNGKSMIVEGVNQFGHPQKAVLNNIVCTMTEPASENNT
jgi:Lar family restriction alleviation protein